MNAETREVLLALCFFPIESLIGTSVRLSGRRRVVSIRRRTALAFPVLEHPKVLLSLFLSRTYCGFEQSHTCHDIQDDTDHVTIETSIDLSKTAL